MSRAPKFTHMQMLFIHEYLVDLNATQAAIRAGYSENNAGKIGAELLEKTHIQEKVQELMDLRAKRVDITADRVLVELAKIGFANIGNFLVWRDNWTVVGHDDDGEPILQKQTVIDLAPSDTVDTAAVQAFKLDRNGNPDLKLFDKKAALSDIARHLGMFAADKMTVEQEGAVEVRVRFVDPADV